MAIEIKIDDEVVLTISDIEELIVRDNLPCFKEWIKEGWLAHIQGRVESSYKKMKLRYQGRLEERYDTIPTRREDRAILILSQPDYEDCCVVVARAAAKAATTAAEIAVTAAKIAAQSVGTETETETAERAAVTAASAVRAQAEAAEAAAKAATTAAKRAAIIAAAQT